MYVSLPNSRQYPQQYLSDLRSRRISEGVIPKRPRRLHVLEPSPVVLIARLSPLVYANYFQDSVDINNAHVLKTRPFHLYTLLVFVCDRLPWPPTRGAGGHPAVAAWSIPSGNFRRDGCPVIAQLSILFIRKGWVFDLTFIPLWWFLMSAGREKGERLFFTPVRGGWCAFYDLLEDYIRNRSHFDSFSYFGFLILKSEYMDVPSLSFS